MVRLVIKGSSFKGCYDRVGGGVEGLKDPGHGWQILFLQLIDQPVQGFASSHTIQV